MGAKANRSSSGEESVRRPPVTPFVGWAVVDPEGAIIVRTIAATKGDAGTLYNYRATLGQKARKRGYHFRRVKVDSTSL